MSGHVISHLSLLQLMAQSDITVPQQHGILDLVQGSSPLVQGVLYLLILFSVLSWGIIFYKSNQVRRAKRESEKFIEIFWDSRNLASIHDASRDLKAGPVAQVFRAGYEELLRVPRGKKEILAAAGLAAAIPALMAYNFFVQRIKELAADMDNFSHEFLNIAERHFLK